jgi:hypothetical protein
MYTYTSLRLVHHPNIALDFYNVGEGSSRIRLLEHCFDSSNSQRRKLTFCYPPIELNGVIHIPPGSGLYLEVEGCSDPIRDAEKSSTLNVQTVTLAKNPSLLSSVYEDMPLELTYYVVVTSLPSIEDLLGWGRRGLAWRAGILKDDIESCLDMLLLGYVSNKPPLPFVSLLILFIITLTRYPFLTMQLE